MIEHFLRVTQSRKLMIMLPTKCENRGIKMARFNVILNGTCFLRVTVSLLCRLHAVSKIHVPIYPCLIISEGDEIVRPFDQHSNETATVRIHVTKYKHIRKLMLVFLGKFENRDIKIAGVNSTHITKNINLL